MYPLITIIIPVYNSSVYLGRCIESVINQTYKNLEIILVNDGSLDDSGEICESFKMVDPRIIVIHQENAGVSAARNKAIENAHGDYIAFVDSDDYIMEDFVESLFMGISENSVDLAICGFEKIGGIDIKTGRYDDSFESEIILLEQSGIVEKNDLWFHCIDTNRIGSYLWNKLFKRALLCKNRLNLDLSIGEDMVCLVEYLISIDKAYYIAKPLYKYQMNEMSALNEIDASNKDGVVRKIQSSMLATELVQKYTVNESQAIKDFVSYRRVRSSLWCMFKIINTNFYDKKLAAEIRNIVRENYVGYIRVNYGTSLQRVAIMVLKYSPRILFLCGRFAITVLPTKIYSYSRR